MPRRRTGTLEIERVEAVRAKERQAAKGSGRAKQIAGKADRCERPALGRVRTRAQDRTERLRLSEVRDTFRIQIAPVVLRKLMV